MDRITAIEKSCKVFICGLIGLFPLIGLLPAIYALVSGRQIRIHYRDSWNPASRYLNAGIWMAALGFLNSAAVLLILVAIVALHGSELAEIFDYAVAPK